MQKTSQAPHILRSAHNKERGTTLLDVIIGTWILLAVFLSLFGAFRLAIEVVVNIKVKTGALALAGEQVEWIRSLAYSDVGTVGGIPPGLILQDEQVTLNNTAYTRRTLIQYVDAPEDGLGVLDENGITNDYKRVKIEITWNLRGNTRSTFLVSNIVPRGIESVAGGGTLTINAIDALGMPVLSADVTIKNDVLNPSVDITTFTNINGVASFPGAPTSTDYRITVTKEGYSISQTYDATAGNPNPSPPHLTVVESQTTSSTFVIDVLSSKTIRTFEPVKPETFSDTFVDTSGLDLINSTNIFASGGSVTLLSGENGYLSPGTLYSNVITPTFISRWDTFSWTDTTPTSTAIAYHLYYDNAGVPVIIPDTDLSGNAVGFTTSPVNLTGLSVTTYPNLKLGATLSTADASTTPSVDSWQLQYQDGPTPLPNIPFAIRGTKTIGSDGGGIPIYKYDQNLSTDGAGQFSTSTLEWDTYTITIDNVSIGYDISESCEPQPRSILPNTAVVTDLFLVAHTPHSLLVSVVDSTGILIGSASANLIRTGYDETQITGVCGQTFFEGIGSTQSSETYTLNVSAAGFQAANVSNVEVNGPVQIQVTLIAI